MNTESVDKNIPALAIKIKSIQECPTVQNTKYSGCLPCFKIIMIQSVHVLVNVCNYQVEAIEEIQRFKPM